MLTGFGAALLHLGVNQFQISMVEAQMSVEQINMVLADGYNALQNGQNFVNPLMGKLNVLYHTPTLEHLGCIRIVVSFGCYFQTPLLFILCHSYQS